MNTYKRYTLWSLQQYGRVPLVGAPYRWLHRAHLRNFNRANLITNVVCCLPLAIVWYRQYRENRRFDELMGNR